MEVLLNVDSPENIKQVRQFVEPVPCFRKYILELAPRTAYIIELTKNDVPFIWTEHREEAKQYVIDGITLKPRLSIF